MTDLSELCEHLLDRVREVPLHEIVKETQRVHKLVFIAPLYNTVDPDEHALHRAQLDVLRRAEDLRRAVIDADELQLLIAVKKKALDSSRSPSSGTTVTPDKEK